MEKGFITIATGDELYYRLAYNLLKSYKFYTSSPMPFAIICDKENEYTKYFDYVIKIDESKKNFMDKFEIFDKSPFEKTIFIDADSLAYNDLNVLWNYFETATDFSCIGEEFSVIPQEKEDCWYEIQDVGKYGENVDYRCRCHAGLMYFRKSERLTKMRDDCFDLINNYETYKFKIRSDSIDECVLAVAMAYNNMRVTNIPENFFEFFPGITYLKLKLKKNYSEYKTCWNNLTRKNISLIHFGTKSTKSPYYVFTIKFINYENKQKKSLFGKILYEKQLLLFILKVNHKISTFFKKVFIKLKLIFKKSK